MKIRLFQSDKGDCLMLTGSGGTNVLVDGGMSGSFTDYVAPTLGRMQKRGEHLDLVYLSHIDQDHILGILKLMDYIVDWRVFDFQSANGNTRFKKPKVPRMPDVKAIWHNSFHDQLEENTGPVADLLAASAAVLSGSDQLDLREMSIALSELAQSERQAIELSKRVSSDQLDIPLNPEWDGKLALVRSPAKSVQLHELEFHLIGPFKDDIEALRDEWQDWLEENENAVTKLRDDAARDTERMGVSEVEAIVGTFLQQAKTLGDRNSVTTPNLASLMVLIEDNGKRALLTGDGHADDIVKGLDHCGLLDVAGTIHVDVLKIQHHGSEHNIDEDFCRDITADHYIFCGNGAHENPEPDVVKALIKARLEDGSNRKFKLWFNSSSELEDLKEKYRKHMEALEDLVRDLRQDSGGRMKASFLKKAFVDVSV